MDLTSADRQRYARHLLLPEVGEAGQRKLKAARVLCVGAGGLGSPATMYLAAAGVGTIGLVDFDAVDLSNLQRQLLHGTPDVGRPKLASAAETLERLNPEVEVIPFETRLTSANALEIMEYFDIVVDGADNFATRYLVNDACVLCAKPNVHGSVLRFAGQAAVFWPAGGGPCYRCLFPQPPPAGSIPSCAEAGVLGVLPGLIGTLQATETLKLILGVGRPLVGRLLTLDALAMRWREIKIARDPRCPVCGQEPSITRLMDYDLACGLPAEADAIEPAELLARRQAGQRPLVLDVREPGERAATAIPETIHIPLGELARRAGELDLAAEIIVHCRSGARSAKAVELLRGLGFARPRNLRGGIVAWQALGAPTVPGG